MSDPGGTRVVINEVYGGGGNSGATYTHDFIELYNPTDEPVSLTGLSVQYRSAAGGGAGYTDLSGTVAAGGYFLVQQARGNGGSVALPTPDTTGDLAMSGSAGTVALVEGTGSVDLGSVTPVDMVGWGSATFREGSPAAGTANATSVARTTAGVDTDDNSADFTVGAPTPQSSGDEPGPDPDPGEPGEVRDVSIAEIQGTGASTPLSDQPVRTEGVVTAAFPTGGFNGFYVQTPGPDTTPQASDGIFVYAPDFDADAVVPGTSVEVTGTATEFGGQTQVDARDGSVTVLADPLGELELKTVVPGTDCELPGTGCLTGDALDQAREKVEGEAFALTGDFTVTDVYDGSAYVEGANSSSANYGEIGLAARSDLPLITPTEVVDPHDAAARGARAAYNEAHRLILDDGSSWNYGAAANTDKPMPWHTPGHHVRVGAAVTFPEHVVLDHRFGWKLQPTDQVVGKPTASQPQFEQTRRAPEDVQGDLKLATFNVLNYFTTFGDTFDDACTSYTDRAGDPVTVRSCPGDGPRGAWEQEDFERQQLKIVKAINALDADVVSVEEIENSLVVDGTERDEALAALVEALNAAAGSERWAYVPSPAELPTDEDVIRTGIIYDPSTVETVGEAQILVGSAAFGNAREPFAQAFRPSGGEEEETFAVIVNHFKSKGSGEPDPHGQGNANADRVAQAEALVTFADEFAEARSTDKVFLTGDFNAYSMEDPIKVLEDAGYTNLESSFDGAEKSYSFDGMSGSLDHVLASEAATSWVEEVDVWESNANETVYAQYSRHNYNVTQLVDDTEFSASDHNPEIVGFSPSAQQTVDLQILSVNDFHGRLGAAPALAGAIGQMRVEEENTLFVSAGDLIGASTFESFIAKDKPAIDVMNAMDLAVSAAGNHEFDAGYDDLVNRVMAPYDADANPYGGAEWQYLAANLRTQSDNSYALGDSAASPGTSDGATWMTEVDGVQVGFVGAVTEDLGSLVSPAGIDELEITSIVDEVNDAADRLTADGADVVILLAHEGAQGASLEDSTDVEQAFGQIVAGVDEDVDAIFSGHTHLRHAHLIDGRPVLSGGEYGTHLARLVLVVDPETDEVSVETNDVVAVAGVTPEAPEALALQAEVQGIVEAANAEAEVLGAAELGAIDGPLRRAVLQNGSENRGGESTLGNLVAEVHRWATRGEGQGAAEIAFMNPGGLRADMVGNADGGYPADVTYRQAAAVQPFANTLVNMDLTGAQLKQVLEEQWQLDEDGNVPTRPFLRLGASEGFTHTYDGDLERGQRITGMWLDGEPIDPARTYSVTVNSFLASGGDNFHTFTDGTDRTDTGQSDLTAMVDYMDAQGTVEVDHSQRAVGLVVDQGPFQPGASLGLEVSSWSFSAPGSVRDDEVRALLDGTVVGTGELNHDLSAEPFDETGTATVQVTLPADIAAGTHVLTLRGATTGTEVTTSVVVEAAAVEKVTPTLTVTGGKKRVPLGSGTTTLNVRVVGGEGTVSGTVRVRDGKRLVGEAEVVDGRARVRVTDLRRLGRRTLTVRYLGDERRTAAQTTVTVRVVRGKPEVAVTVPGKVKAGARKPIRVSVTAGDVKAKGRVRVVVKLKGRTTVRTVRLRQGSAAAKVRFHRQGQARVRVVYLGSPKLAKASRTIRVKVAGR